MHNKPTAISLFSGAGGLDIAAAEAGFDILHQVEINDYCRGKLNEHSDRWPNAARHVSDVREFGAQHVRRPIDLIFGGFPCQPWSTAGARLGAADERNLWPEFARIIGEIRPRAILLENVASITAPYEDANGTVQPAYALMVINALSEMGYMGSAGIISAADAGAAHIRSRWWAVGYTTSTRLSAGFKTRIAPYPTKTTTGVESEPKRSNSNVGHPNIERFSQSKMQRPNIQSKFTPIKRTGAPRYTWSSQSRMGGDAHGVSPWMVRQRPALQGQHARTFEPSRTVQAHKKGRDHREAIAAIGNSVYIPLAYALFVAVAETLNAQDD